MDILLRMGNTPLHLLQSAALAPKSSARVIVKLEEFNPGGSIKARVALNMVLAAEKIGNLQPHTGQTIIEPTGGNTGVGLAMIGAARGYRVVLVVPDNYVSPLRLKILEGRGAEIIQSDHTKGNDSHIEAVRQLVNEHPDYVWLNQFENPANPDTHYRFTATEILREVNQVDAFVAGIGSGGTITGVGQKLRESNPAVQVIGVQPDGCDVVRGTAIPHRLQGLAVGMVPPILRPEVISSVRDVAYERSLETIRRLARLEGLFVGISAGANISTALDVAREIGPGKTVVTIAPDSGANYVDRLEEIFGK